MNASLTTTDGEQTQDGCAPLTTTAGRATLDDDDNDETMTDPNTHNNKSVKGLITCSIRTFMLCKVLRFDNGLTA